MEEASHVVGIEGLESLEEGEVVVNTQLVQPILFQKVMQTEGPNANRLGWITMGEDTWVPSADVVMFFELQGVPVPAFYVVIGKGE